jgi:hypothetical protein
MGTAFLSPEWLAEVDQLRASTDGLLIPPGMGGMAVDLQITDDPAGDGRYHLEGAPGGLAIKAGPGEAPAATVHMTYALAKAMFVNADQAAVMQGFSSGAMRIDGDMTKLMALAQGLASVDATRTAFEAQIKSLTA